MGSYDPRRPTIQTREEPPAALLDHDPYALASIPVPTPSSWTLPDPYMPAPGELPSQPRTRRLNMLLSEESELLLELLVVHTTVWMTPSFVNCTTSRSQVTHGR
jgi:hypothetical protein